MNIKRFSLGCGLLIVVAALAVAFLAPWIASEKPDVFSLSSRLMGPQAGHPFGFDEDGRDVLSLIFWGARVSLGIGFATVFLAAAVGTFFGMLAGYFGGKVDQGFILVTDVLMSFPSILLIIALAAFYRESGIWTVVGILSFVGWVGYARVVRAQVLTLRERDFVTASRGVGASFFRIAWKHLLPNLAGPLLVQGSFGMAGVILAESTLSFLGLGLPADVPSWGRLLDQGVQYLLVAPHLSLFPGLAIALLILGFNFLGDGLRDQWDVKEIK